MDFRSEYCGRKLVKAGFWAFYVRETARDMLFKKKPAVINILTNADLLQISKLFPDIEYLNEGNEYSCFLRAKYPVQFFICDYSAYRAVHLPGLIDSKKDAYKLFAERSLFTVNSFVYDFKNVVFYDTLDAYSHFKKKLVQTIRTPEQSVPEHPTIALKTAKILSETGFEIDRSLYDFLIQNRSLYDYKNINEEIAAIFLDILVSGRAYEGLNLLNAWGVFDDLLPEVALLKEVDQDKEYHPEGNGFWHTLECMKFVKRPNKRLMMAILLHDTGKALTQAGNRKTKPFPNHSVASKVVAKKVLKRFHSNNEDIEEVLFLVKYHMILNAIDRLPENRLRTIFTSPYFPDLLELYRADLESGYHKVQGYYHAARLYKEFMRKDKLRKQGVYA